MAENIVDPLMQPEIILTENDVPGAKLTNDLAECNVDDLKRWLECRGQKKGGRKAELVARVEGLLKLNLPIDSKIDNGLWYKQKKQKNSHVMLYFIDISIPGDGWRDFPSRNLPQNFNYGNIYHYLVESINKVCCHDDYDDEEYGDKGESIGEVTSRPLKKGTWLLKSGFVLDP